ncbi:MAG: peptidylprolyl isomerase [Alphaproteobacteria bacterium]|nr:peptidylprolyl isomerase [Alphaproteobacteria bacterium]
MNNFVKITFVITLASLLSVVNISAQERDLKKVVAEVGKDKVLEEDLLFRYQQLPPQTRQQNSYDDARDQLINQLVIERLFAAEARRDGLQKDKEVAAAIKRTESTILHQAFVQNFARNNISDAELAEEYKKFSENYAKGAEYRARHVLVETEREGLDIVKKLNNGSDFAELAKTYSTGPSAPRGGDLGYFREGQMVPEFERALKLLDSGKYTRKPVETQFGWHVIKLEDKRAAEVPELARVENELRQGVAERKLRDELEKLRKKYPVTIKE